MDVWDYLELYAMGPWWHRNTCGAACSQSRDEDLPGVWDMERAAAISRRGRGRVKVIVAGGKLTSRHMWPRSDASHAYAMEALGLAA